MPDDVRFISAFPVIANPVPRIDLRLEEFHERVRREPPHWLYHLEIAPDSSGRLSSRFAAHPGERLRKLVGRLPLGAVAAGRGFQLRPREFSMLRLRRQFHEAELSDHTFALPSRGLAGCSFGLTVALLAAAAASGHPLPPWLVASGCLRRTDDDSDDYTSDLQLAPVGHLVQKIHIVLGDEPQYDLEPIISLLYNHQGTAEFLGPRHERAISGGIKLFLVAMEKESLPAEVTRSFHVQFIPGAEAKMAACRDLGELEGLVRGWAGGGAVLLGVRTAFDALYTLGYHHVLPQILDLVSRRGGPWCRAYRVASLGDPSHPRRWDTEQALLNAAMAKEPNYQQKLQVLLRRCCELLHCDGGDVVVKTDENPDLLRVESRFGIGAGELPSYVPGTSGINFQVLSTGRPAIVPRIDQNEHYCNLTAENSPAQRLYERETWLRYLAFLRQVRACAKFPLASGHAEETGTGAIGVLCLHSVRAADFDPRMLQVVEALVPLASSLVSSHLKEEAEWKRIGDSLSQRDSALATKTVPLPSAVDESSGSAPAEAALGAKLEALPPVAIRAEQELAGELVQFAMEISGAYRACVRVLSPNRESLWVAALAPREKWPHDYKDRIFTLDGGTAAAAAIQERKCIWLPDTAVKAGVAYEPIEPAARSHASILLLAGNKILGVLSVDCETPGQLTRTIRDALVHLANGYAVAMQSWRIDQVFVRLTQDISLDDDGRDIPYREVLESAAWALAASRGAIFVRRRDSGRYHLAASLLHPEWSGDDWVYDGSVGLTGWVASNNRALRLRDVRSTPESAAFGPNPPRFQNHVWDGKRKDEFNPTYLGVPIAHGCDVFGVMRMASQDKGTGFVSEDQATAQVIAARLGARLGAQDAAMKANAYRNCLRAAASATTATQLAESLFTALRDGIGSCEIEWRLRKRVACHGNGWLPGAGELPLGEGIAGSVLQTASPLEYDDAQSECAAQLVRERSHGTGSGMCAPITGAADGVRGTLHVHREYPRSLLGSDRRFVQQVADLAGWWLRDNI